MGVAVFVAVERKFAGYDPSSVIGKPLAAAIEQLDAACERLGVATLSSFVSADPAEIEALTSDEPPPTPEEIDAMLASLREHRGIDPGLADDLEALANFAASADPDAPPMPERWFEPEAALVPVRALLPWLREPATKLAANPFTRDDVIADLRSVEDVLTVASQASVRFHFAYDI